MKKLMVTCDDCGLSEGINLAAADLYERRIATAATIMTNFSAAAHALDLFSRYPSLDIGIHLTLSDGAPLTTVAAPSLLTTPTGNFRNRMLLYIQALVPSAEFRGLLKAELEAQIRVLVEAGIQPQHITTHSHFHVIPTLREIVFELAEQYRVRWVRAYRYAAAVLPFNPVFRTADEPTTDGERPFAIPNYLVGLKYWLNQDPGSLFERLDELDGITEIVVHPSLPQDDTFPEGVYYSPAERHQEVQYLEQLFRLLTHQEMEDDYERSNHAPH